MARTALVTGCSSGIGRATALRLVREGWATYASARRPETLDELVAAGCRALELDVTDEASRAQAVAAIGAAGASLDLLVNNAGYSQSGALETVSLEEVRAQFETNVFGLLSLCQQVLPEMRARGRGRIVNISSMGGRLTFPGGGAYHATKHAIEALSDALRFEVAGFGIDVIVVEPGLIKTRFAEAAHATIPHPDGPYASFNRAVAATTVRGYEGWLARVMGGGPERVAAVVARAASARRPKTRYRVTASASMFIGLRRLLPDRAWDAMLARSFPRPRP